MAISFGSDVSRLNYNFDREGMYLPYFTKKTFLHLPENDEERSEMEYNSHIGYVNAALSRLDQAELQALQQGGFVE